jgi:hypothetical protein
MAHLITTALRSASLLAQVLVLSVAATGCTTEVVDEEAEGEDQAAAVADCTELAGDGCEPGESQGCDSGVQNVSGPGNYPGEQICEVVGECETKWGYCAYNTPLVLSFENGPVELVADATHTFDINGSASIITDWPSSETPWLAIDHDGNGRIDDGTELFGSMSALKSGLRASNGFVALRELDANADGRITADDAGFDRLLIWSDRDADRVSSQGELAPIAARSLVSIDLDYTSDPRCDARGNCEVERAEFRYVDAHGAVRTGTVIDIHLAAQR